MSTAGRALKMKMTTNDAFSLSWQGTIKCSCTADDGPVFHLHLGLKGGNPGTVFCSKLEQKTGPLAQLQRVVPPHFWSFWQAYFQLGTENRVPQAPFLLQVGAENRPVGSWQRSHPLLCFPPLNTSLIENSDFLSAERESPCAVVLFWVIFILLQALQISSCPAVQAIVLVMY